MLRLGLPRTRFCSNVDAASAAVWCIIYTSTRRQIRLVLAGCVLQVCSQLYSLLISILFKIKVFVLTWFLRVLLRYNKKLKTCNSHKVLLMVLLYYHGFKNKITKYK